MFICCFNDRDTFNDIVFDSETLLFHVLSMKHGEVPQEVILPLWQLFVTTSKFGDMVTLRSQEHGYIGTVKADYWSSLTADIHQALRSAVNRYAEENSIEGGNLTVEEALLPESSAKLRSRSTGMFGSNEKTFEEEKRDHGKSVDYENRGRDDDQDDNDGDDDDENEDRIERSNSRRRKRRPPRIADTGEDWAFMTSPSHHETAEMPPSDSRPQTVRWADEYNELDNVAATTTRAGVKDASAAGTVTSESLTPMSAGYAATILSESFKSAKSLGIFQPTKFEFARTEFARPGSAGDYLATSRTFEKMNASKRIEVKEFVTKRPTSSSSPQRKSPLSSRRGYVSSPANASLHSPVAPSTPSQLAQPISGLNRSQANEDESRVQNLKSHDDYENVWIKLLNKLEIFGSFEIDARTVTLELGGKPAPSIGRPKSAPVEIRRSKIHMNELSEPRKNSTASERNVGGGGSKFAQRRSFGSFRRRQLSKSSQSPSRVEEVESISEGKSLEVVEEVKVRNPIIVIETNQLFKV